MNKIIYTWDNITTIIKNNIYKIQNYNPDIVIAIGGGGLIPARLIRNYIKKPIYVVTLSLYDDDQIKDNVTIIQWLDINLKGKKVLIIDEIDDTRKTIDCCVSKLRNNNNADTIAVCVLQNKLKEKYADLKDVHYISFQEIEDKWVVYPWD